MFLLGLDSFGPGVRVVKDEKFVSFRSDLVALDVRIKKNCTFSLNSDLFRLKLGGYTKCQGLKTSFRFFLISFN